VSATILCNRFLLGVSCWAFLAGRFGSTVQVASKRALHISQRVVIGGVGTPLFNEQQGTIEFWVLKQRDQRLTPIKLPSLCKNRVLTIALPNNLKLDDWPQIALIWGPHRGDAERTITDTYIDGRNSAFYRSENWDGCSIDCLSSGPKTAKRLMKFVSRAVAVTAFAVDEVRVSSIARYADWNVIFGPQQTFNPVRFNPSTESFQPDPQTLWLMHFDEDFKASVPAVSPEARLAE